MVGPPLKNKEVRARNESSYVMSRSPKPQALPPLTDLTQHKFGQHMSVVLGVLALTSKDSAGVTGSGFITLAATLACASHYRDLGWRQTVRRPRDVFTERRDTCADLVP